MCNKLEEYTSKLPPLDELVVGRQMNMIRYEVETGSVYGIGLFKNPTVAVQLATLSKGSKFPEHVHKEPVAVEWLHVIKGELKCICGEGSRIIKATESIKFVTNQKHKVEAIEDTEVIAITMPSDKGFPDVK